MKFLIFLTLLISTSIGFAKGGPCKADRKTLCSTVEKGQGKIGRCLFDNWAKVSTDCKAKKQKNYDRWSARKQACGADIAKFCKDVNPGVGRSGKCLRQNKKELSTSCQDFLKERKGRHKAKMASCEKDISQFCGAIEKGDGRTWKCLVENQESLSEDCKTQWPSLARRKKPMGKSAQKKQ